MRWPRLLAPCIAALLFAVAASPGTLQQPEAARSAAEAAIWLDVPYVRQPPDGCGAACIFMVLKYWTLKDPAFKCDLPDVDAIQRKLYSPKARGIYARDMESYLRSNGLQVYAFRGDLSLLREHLAKGRPLIVCLREERFLHYVVVVGLDPAKREILVNDPAGSRLEPIGQTTFLSKWRAKGNWTLLALPGSPR